MQLSSSHSSGSSYSSFSTLSSISFHDDQIDQADQRLDRSSFASEPIHLESITNDRFQHTVTPVLNQVSPNIADNSRWTLASERDNIKVYTQAVPNSGFKAIRAEMVTKGSLEKITPIAVDPVRIPELLSNLESVNMLDDVESNYKHLELISKSYWQIPPRIIFSEYEYHKHVEDGGVHIKMAKTDQYSKSPDEPGVVVPKFESNILFRRAASDQQSGGDQVEVFFESYLEPGGFLRPFIINSLTVSQTMGVMKNIREKAANM